MLAATFAGSFWKDHKLMQKRHLDMDVLDGIIRRIINEEPLPEHCRPHRLRGKRWEGKWECHIENDWLLVYVIDPAAKKVVFHNLGAHSDLFKK
jgi:mRNA interferase YafQ